MATELPPIGLGAATGVDATGPSERVQDWTEHEVAEWAAFSVSTREDYTHTFLVHRIDGRALLGLTREQLTDWKVKVTDVNVILKGVADLKRINDGTLGWQVGGGGPPTDATQAPPKPTAPKQPKARPAPRGANAYGKPAASPHEAHPWRRRGRRGAHGWR